MIIVVVRYSFRARLSMGVENFHIEKGSAESAFPESIGLDGPNKMGPSVMRRYVQRLDRAAPTLYKYIGKIL